MPDTAKPRTLITSALPYINGIKHLGNLVGSQLPADVYARFCRATGHEVMFICATDEHGTPAEIAAQNAGQDVAEYCEQMHAKQAELADWFNISFDHFGRSSSPENHRLTQHFATVLEQNGMIEMVSEKQIYSPTDGRFLPDRYIEGTCPNCGYEEARGDQCENCTKQLNPTDLLDARSKISGATNLEVRETNHLYLKQSLKKDALDKWIGAKTHWPLLTTSIAKKWLHDGDGLRDRGITRDLNWGVPVCKIIDDKPVAWAGMEGKVFYVWFDAPIAYIAATEKCTKNDKKLNDDAWQTWWRTDKGAKDVNYVQFMGKDNVPFHTLSFPACLMGSGEDWKQVDYIKAFNYLNFNGGQFSTSKGRGVFMDDARDTGIPSDCWRWWLMSNVPEGNDSEFTWESFQQTVNKDLSDVLGNFVSRVTKFCNSKWGAVVPDASGDEYLDEELELLHDLAVVIKAYEKHMNEMEFRKAAQKLREMWALGNLYLQRNQPWAVYKEFPEYAGTIIFFALNLIVLFANFATPFIPDTSAKIHEFMGTKPSWTEMEEWLEGDSEPPVFMPAGHKFTVPENLFEKITDDQIAELSARFSGDS
ncbi:MAG: methionine--tRNA ligase [Candidatus Halichondribacter symbioticus]